MTLSNFDYLISNENNNNPKIYINKPNKEEIEDFVKNYLNKENPNRSKNCYNR